MNATNEKGKPIRSKIPERMRSCLVLIAVLIIQYAVYLLFFHSFILKWGATETECAMSMPGDQYAEAISCTRAIDIHRAPAEVWPYLADLGADRRGFYSYGFLERLYGCEITKHLAEEKREMNLGRLVPYTSPDAVGNYTEGFLVVEVTPGQSFVLKEWGGFLIRETGGGNTRLFIRTHWKTPHNVIDRLWGSVFDAGHYIMEKRMMLGIKDYAESNGTNYTLASDLIWFLGVVVSGLAGLLLIFLLSGYFKLWIPTLFLTIWQYFLWVMNPTPIVGISLVLLVSVLIYLNRLSQKRALKRD